MQQARKKRSLITQLIITIVRNALEKGKTTSDISKQIEFSYSATLVLINKITQGLQDKDILARKKEQTFHNSSVEIKNQIAMILNNDNALTQKGISQELSLVGIERSQGSISKILADMEYTRKRLSRVPIERNCPRIINLRREYALAIQHFSDEQMVFLDETSFNLHSTRNYGYSPKNTKAVAMVPANRGVNISLMAAISVNGIISHELQDGAYNGDMFINFINQSLLTYFQGNSSAVIIMDNCKFHHRADVLQVLNNNNIRYKFLPAYSPQLNPIEEFFGEVKANYNSIRPTALTRDEVKNRVVNLLARREGNFVAYYTRMRSFVQDALARNLFI